MHRFMNNSACEISNICTIQVIFGDQEKSDAEIGECVGVAISDISTTGILACASEAVDDDLPAPTLDVVQDLLGRTVISLPSSIIPMVHVHCVAKTT
tara:strand:- start:6116 stop:6406 length:291 start_codon:yes stop_codon:yes gene_type:complete